MAIGANHVTLCITSLLILTLLIISMSSTNWVHTTSKNVNTINNGEYKQQGLWRECKTNQGNVQCYSVRKDAQINQLPLWLGYGRIGMIIACTLTFVASVTAIFGNPVLSFFSASKKVMTITTASALLISGILALTAYSITTNATHNNKVLGVSVVGNGKSNAFNMVNQYVIGWATYMGFIGSIFEILLSLYAIKVAMDMNSEGGEDEKGLIHRHNINLTSKLIVTFRKKNLEF